MGGIARGVVYHLVGWLPPAVLTKGGAGIGVAVKTREVAAGYLQTQLVSRPHEVAGGPQVDGVLVHLSGLDEGRLGRRCAVTSPDDAVLLVQYYSDLAYGQELAQQRRDLAQRRGLTHAALRQRVNRAQTKLRELLG